MKSITIKDQKGFTLIEILISIMMLAIILVGGIQLYINAHRIMVLTKHKSMAIEVANSRLEQLKTQSFSSITESNLNNESPRVMDGVTFNKNYEVTNQDYTLDGVTDFKNVWMQVSWKEEWMNDDKVYEFVASYANP